MADIYDRADKPSPRGHAAERAAELRRRARRMQTHQPITREDAELAAQRAAEAHVFARSAELAAAERFEESARTHEQTAQLHEQAVEHGHGDLAAHRAAARHHREAAAKDRVMAEQKRREAAAELRSLNDPGPHVSAAPTRVDCVNIDGSGR